MPIVDSIMSFIRSLAPATSEAEVGARIADARRRTPIPVLWLFGKTQTGKTSIVKFLTGADDAEIGNGFRPCTRFSRSYDFPNSDAPLMTFLDTRGLDEPDYDPAEDIARFNESAHLVIATVKAMDHAQENVLSHVEQIRQAGPTRPILLALTCLHEAYPQRQHSDPYPFETTLYPESAPHSLLRSIGEQQRRFRDLANDIIPIDLTNPEEGFHNPIYGGDELKKSIIRHLPELYRQTLIALDRGTHELRDAAVGRAMPIILGYSYFAAGAGAIPIPFVDLLIIPGIQVKLVMELAELYGQPLAGKGFMELAAGLGLGLVARQAAREFAKFIPVVGAAAGAALAGASTYALGRAFCFYYQSVHEGHVPDSAAVKHLFEEQMATAERSWFGKSSTSEAKP
jgi:uncharacterized protein (DUF697 family)